MTKRLKHKWKWAPELRRKKCKHGHRLIGKNRYRRPDGRGFQCRKCAVKRKKLFMLNKKYGKKES